ncbi:MAG: hypothetical protein AB8B88_04365 [Devosiaceae bacterium]
MVGKTKPQEPKTTALYASPIRAGIAGVILVACGLGLASLPFYLAVQSTLFGFTLFGTIVGTLLLVIAGFIAWPGLVLLRAIITATPLITTDGQMVEKMRMGMGTAELSWENVGDITLRGMWVILLDGRIKQSRFSQIMFGAKGIWIPALLMHGGGANTMRFIEQYKPELIDPLIAKVVSGGR